MKWSNGLLQLNMDALFITKPDNKLMEEPIQFYLITYTVLLPLAISNNNM